VRRLVVGTVLLLSCVTAAPAQAATVTVKTQGLHFVPATARAHIGDTVTWVNAATDRHSSTADGPTPWDSGNLNPWKGTYSRVFPIAGSFPYYCKIHRSLNMTGTIKVAVNIAPKSGTTASDFVVTVARAGTKPPVGYVYVVERALGSAAFTTLVRTTASNVHFRAASSGTYAIRAGLQKSSGATNAAWFSEPTTVTVS
jgi:plastocyanin